MTDRELLSPKDDERMLLELAAKAQGYKYMNEALWDGRDVIGYCWNPLTDDGDALRLAVKLGINVPTRWEHEKMERCGLDVYAATRRAIVRAAAAIGETL